MDTIIIGFSRPHKWKPYAWMISKLWGTEYSHVYIRFYSKTYDRHMIYQASHLSVNFTELNNFLTVNKIVKEFPIDICPTNKTKMMQFAIDNASKPYGILSAIGLGIKQIAACLGKKIKNPFADGKNTYICCELAGVILEQFTGADLGKDEDDLSPKDVYDYLAKKFAPK